MRYKAISEEEKRATILRIAHRFTSMSDEEILNLPDITDAEYDWIDTYVDHLTFCIKNTTTKLQDK